MNNHNLEKKTISFGKPLLKKDIIGFLTRSFKKGSYEMFNIGNFADGANNPVQNDCSGAIDSEGTKINYILTILADNTVKHMQLAYPSETGKATLESAERKIADFFSTYSTNAS